MTIKPGTMLGNFRVIEKIGEGGMGEVYRAEEALLGRKVAIKVLNPSYTHDPQFQKRFLNEAQVQASLLHPNIVGLFSFFEHDGTYIMAMEFAEGITLRELLNMTGPLQESRALHILRQILDALQYAHAKNVIHRDIKPGNIMVGPGDSVKIMDFGIARLMSAEHITQTGSRLGTPHYMSPEQILTPREVDGRADIYSTGIVFYEMLCGKLPFSKDIESQFVLEKQIVDNQLPDPRDFYPYISDRALELLYEMVPGNRELRGDFPRLQRLLAGDAPSQGHPDFHPSRDPNVVSAAGSGNVSRPTPRQEQPVQNPVPRYEPQDYIKPRSTAGNFFKWFFITILVLGAATLLIVTLINYNSNQEMVEEEPTTEEVSPWDSPAEFPPPDEVVPATDSISSADEETPVWDVTPDSAAVVPATP